MNAKQPKIVIIHSDQQRKLTLFIIWLLIKISGASPIFISSASAREIKDMHGLLLLGGSDIEPNLYGENSVKGKTYEAARDELELKYLKIADESDLPTFGICRGAQIMNVYRGGTLHLDIEKIYEKAKYPTSFIGYLLFRKKILINNDSLLFQILHQSNIKVNSIHSQSIDRLGSHLTITAKEENNVIQCIEDKNKLFFMGVQFHPEYLSYKPQFKRLFHRFVVACERYQKSHQ